MTTYRVALLALCVAFARPVHAADQTQPSALNPTPEAQVNDLIAEYTIRYQFNNAAQAIPVAEKALALAEQLMGPESAKVAQILNDLGYFHQLERHFTKAQQLHQRALKIRERLHGNGAELVQSLVNLGKAYAGNRKFGLAQPLYERALAIAEKNVQPNDLFLVGILTPYAATLRGRRDTKAAYQVEMRIKQIHAAQPGAAKPSIGDVLK